MSKITEIHPVSNHHLFNLTLFYENSAQKSYETLCEFSACELNPHFLAI